MQVFCNEFTLSYYRKASIHISGVQRQSVTIIVTLSADNTCWYGSVPSPSYALTPAAFDGTFQGTPHQSIGIMLANKISWVSKCIKMQTLKIQTINNNDKT